MTEGDWKIVFRPLRELPPPKTLDERVMKAIDTQSRPMARLHTPYVPIVAAACIVAVGVGALVFGHIGAPASTASHLATSAASHAATKSTAPQSHAATHQPMASAQATKSFSPAAPQATKTSAAPMIPASFWWQGRRYAVQTWPGYKSAGPLVGHGALSAHGQATVNLYEMPGVKTSQAVLIELSSGHYLRANASAAKTPTPAP